ncbi:MAG: RNA polymerase-binding protein DksA [Gammaproteobacteria bacterium]|jgi:DnaK suppressor protein|nr:RNA polymerase-binding protein DksA [Gammaproteobacteria bacterium]
MAAKSGDKSPKKPRTKAAAKAAAKATSKSAPKKQAPAKKQAASAGKAAAKQSATKKAAAKKPAAKKTAAKKAPKTKAAAKKTSAKDKATAESKAPAKKAASKSTTKSKAKARSQTTRKQSQAKQSRGSDTATMKTTSSAAPARPQGSAADSPFKNFTPYEPAKNEEYMSDAQMAHFRSILLKWRQELMEEVDRTVHHMRDEAANFPDPADRATQEEEFSIELRTRDRERKLIKKIDQTIDRLDQHDFGFCDTCGVEIGLRRLEARPTATQCVDCKSLDEIKERQLHG